MKSVTPSTITWPQNQTNVRYWVDWCTCKSHVGGEKYYKNKIWVSIKLSELSEWIVGADNLTNYLKSFNLSQINFSNLFLNQFQFRKSILKSIYQNIINSFNSNQAIINLHKNRWNHHTHIKYWISKTVIKQVPRG